MWGDGETEVATVKKDGVKVADRRFKKDQDIDVNLKDIIESDIMSGNI